MSAEGVSAIQVFFSAGSMLKSVGASSTVRYSVDVRSRGRPLRGS